MGNYPGAREFIPLDPERFNKARKAKRKRLVKGFALTKGADHPSAKLTEEQVREIRKMRGSHRKIGLQFGMSGSAVGKIKRKESWGWLK